VKSAIDAKDVSILAALADPIRLAIVKRLSKVQAGGEYMLVSLGGCFTSHFLAAIRAREAAVTNVRVAVTGTLDGTPERFTAFTMDVSAQCPDPELARTLITMAGRACQVVNTLRQVAPIAITYEGSPIELSEAMAVS